MTDKTCAISIGLSTLALAATFALNYTTVSRDLSRAWAKSANDQTISSVNAYTARQLKEKDVNLYVEITPADLDKLIDAKIAVAEKSQSCCTNVIPAEVDYSFRVQEIKPPQVIP